MKKLTALLLTIAIVSTFPALASGQSSRLQYPDAERGNVSDTYFGTRVADPYRWLEDLDSAQTRAWVTAQAA